MKIDKSFDPELRVFLLGQCPACGDGWARIRISGATTTARATPVDGRAFIRCPTCDAVFNPLTFEKVETGVRACMTKHNGMRKRCYAGRFRA